MGPGLQGRLRFEHASSIQQILIIRTQGFIFVRTGDPSMTTMVSTLLKQGNTTVRNLLGIVLSWRRGTAAAILSSSLGY